jgi:ribA/ribD-fused uncharacterized protein
VDSLETENREMKNILKELEKKVNENSLMKQENKQLRKDLIALETYGRRENLIFDGISEKENETCSKTILLLCRNKLGIADACEKIKITRCHRLGYKKVDNRRPRPIIVRFLFYPDRQMVWEHRQKLKGSNIYMKEDFPSEIERERRDLIPFLYAARDQGKKASLVGNRLVIDSQSYTRDTLDKLPQSLSPRQVSEKTVGDYHFFQGKMSPFSNFYPSEFIIDGRLYNCVEQFYCSRLGVHVGDEIAVKNIMKAKEPAEQKALGGKIKVDRKSWLCEHAREIMKEGLLAKFSQNPALGVALKDTGTRTLVECNKHDVNWGIGLALSDSRIKDIPEWRGNNWLGDCLAHVRDII